VEQKTVVKVSKMVEVSENGVRRSEREDHLQKFVLKKQEDMKYLKRLSQTSVIEESRDPSILQLSANDTEMSNIKNERLEKDTEEIIKENSYQNDVGKHIPLSSIEIKMNDFSYKIRKDVEDSKIKTVVNQSFLYAAYRWVGRVYRRQKAKKKEELVVLESVDLVFKPGRMYLVLGDPNGGGKEALLKAIAGRLHESRNCFSDGNILFNGLSFKDNSGIFLENCISYVDKTDNHAPRMTVKETCDFAFDCKAGGSHVCLPPRSELDPEARAVVQKYDKERYRTKRILESAGLAYAAETFVGNNEIRGVSGGQRRRVSLCEMLQTLAPVICGDEISTGLDAATTYDICRSMMIHGQRNQMIHILSLLQPSPETASLFDDVILLAKGRVLFSGNISEVEPYFLDLGYVPPDGMDLADFMQEIVCTNGLKIYSAENDKHRNGKPYSMIELADKFKASAFHARIIDSHETPWENSWVDLAESGAVAFGGAYKKYRVSLPKALYLNLFRKLLTWSRDKKFLLVNTIKNVVMGISVGAVFYQTDEYVSIFGVFFQTNLFIMLGAMLSAPSQVSDRVIYFKHYDSNFFDASSYVLGNSIGMMPQFLMDVIVIGTIIYWMVGLTAAASNFFIFLASLFVFSLVMNQMLSVFAAIAKTKTMMQSMSAGVIFLQLLFCGFLVNPNVIPVYYKFIYWWNPFAWTYRALLVNEFYSEEYSEIDPSTGRTEGENILLSQGFEINGEVFGHEWVGYSFVYLIPYFMLCCSLTAILLTYVRVDSQDFTNGGDDAIEESETHSASEEGIETDSDISIPVKPVTLTFRDICYDVTASKGSAKIRLLDNVNGVFRPKKMTALMGSSGAGKTTLMDVIAMRKSIGTVTGEILVNGFPQEENSFRRVTGYVEQFDVQAPELTVRETIIYSARLRLESNIDNARMVQYVNSVLGSLELTEIEHCLVGNDEEGGLNFEQRKRLSVAIELAASPSIIFLDEPTSGLDARAAANVVKSLRQIAYSGRTIIATIHQPSYTIFEMFDELLLLQKGGQTVFFGELGNQCVNLVDYFESLGAPPIGAGQNPANWMLTVITEEALSCDFIEAFKLSEKYLAMINLIKMCSSEINPDDEIKFPTKFAASWWERQRLTEARFRTIYFRSPAYNWVRLLLSAVIAFILGSMFLSNRNPPIYQETDMSSFFATIFIAFIITGILAINSVLPVMLKLRDSFYRHRAAGMLGPASIALALGAAEKWFIVLSTLVFCLIFLPTAGLIPQEHSIRRVIAFWGFFTFNLAIYSYFGQMFMCMVPSMRIAQILAAVFVGLNNFFSGFIVRPQYLAGLFKFTAWITPGSYVYEGLIVAAFKNDPRKVIATPGSKFYIELGCESDYCEGTVDDYVNYFFGGEYSETKLSTALIIGVLTIFLLTSRIGTGLALKYCNYTST